MLIQEISSAFLTRYKRISFQRDLKVQQLNKAEIALMISEAQQDIQKRLDVIIGSSGITLYSGYSAYNLPNDFGKLKFAMIGNLEVDIVSDYTLLTTQPSTGNPIKCAVYNDGNIPKLVVYPVPTETTTLYIYYSVDTNYYQPTQPNPQNWGSFNGTEFSGKLLLPDKYDRAVNLFMLAQFFDDYELKYRDEILSLRGNQAAGQPLKTDYHFGTPKKSTPLSGFTSIAASTYLPGTTSVLQFLIAQSGTNAPVIVNTFVNDFINLPTLARTSTGVYTITLTGAFTANKTFLHKPNIDLAVVNDEASAELEHTSVDTITLRVFDTVYDLTDGFNAIWIKIEVQNTAFVPISTLTPAAIVSSLADAPTKRLRFRASDDGTYTAEFSTGWDITPTIVNNVSTLVVTSANNEFNDYVQVETSIEDFTWTQTGANTITITCDPSSGWGNAEIIIDIHE